MTILIDAVGPLFMLGLLAIPVFAIVVVGLIEGFTLYKFSFTENLRVGLYHGLIINTLSLAIGLCLLPQMKDIDSMWAKAALLVAASVVSEGLWVYFRLKRQRFTVFLWVVVGMNVLTALLIWIASRLLEKWL